MDSILSQEDPLEEGIPAHSSILAWRIPWTEESGSQASLTEETRLSDEAGMHTCRMYAREMGSQMTAGGCSGQVREEPGYLSVFWRKIGSQTSKDYC